MIDADRIREARRRLHRAWIFGGLVWSIFFVGVANIVVWMAGVERAGELSTLMMLALVLALGAWGILHLGALLLHIAKRLLSGQPIMERD